MSGRLDLAVSDPSGDEQSRSLRSRLDFARAVAEGPLAWRQSGARAAPHAAFAILNAVGTAGTVVALLVVAFHEAWLPSAPARIVFAAIVIALGAFTSGMPWFRTESPTSHAHRASAAVRTLVLLAVAAVWLATTTPSLAPLSWPVGLLIATEATTVARLIGRSSTPREVAGQYLFSPLHLGLVSACALLLLVGPDRFGRSALAAFISIESVWFTAAVTQSLLGWLMRREDDLRAEAQRIDHEAEARHRAHWIHDDVCAEIRQLRLRIARSPLTAQMLSDDLNEFETRIRERQLDEVIETGSVTAAEVLQPYVRKAQSAGVLITAVPSFDDASIELDASTARQLKRCVAGFVSNALQAGASQLGFSLHSADHELVLEVTDDAGGFQLSEVPAGRGLWLLRADLGEGNLRTEPRGAGTAMIASLTLGVHP